LYEIATGKDRREFPELPTDLNSPGEQEALSELNAIILKACQPDPAQPLCHRRRPARRPGTARTRTLDPASAGLAGPLDPPAPDGASGGGGRCAMVAVALLIRSCGEPEARSVAGSALAQADGKARMPGSGGAVVSPGAFVLPFRNEGTNGVPDDLRCRITDAFIDALALVKGVPRCPRKSGWAYWDETELHHALARTNVFGHDHCAYGLRMPFPLAVPKTVMFNNYPNGLAGAISGQKLCRD